jgi:hypothetical protein
LGDALRRMDIEISQLKAQVRVLRLEEEVDRSHKKEMEELKNSLEMFSEGRTLRSANSNLR